MSGVIRHDIGHKETSYNLISRSHVSQDSQDFNKIMADGHHRWSDSKPGVDTLECTSNVIKTRIENPSFGYDLTSEI